MHSEKIFLTFDIEEFYNSELIARVIGDNIPANTSLENNIDRLIDICAEYNIKATWFVLGEVAKNKPRIVKKIFNSGHEVASHSFSHRLVYNMTPSDFEYDLKKSLSVLEDITGEKVIGYRAPSWSVKNEILDWFYDILIENGIKYSSSVYPGKTFLYGISDATERIHKPVVNGKEKNIIEIPQSLLNLIFMKIGFSGGFYLRITPKSIIKILINKKLKKYSGLFIYLHPYEIEVPEYKINLGRINNFIQYYNTRTAEKKLIYLIKIYKDFIQPVQVIVSKIAN